MQRVLFCAPPQRGHWQAMRPLAHAFHRRRCTVRWATGSDALADLASEGFSGWSCGPTRQQCRKALQDRWPAQATQPQASARHGLERLFGHIVAPAMWAPLDAIVQAWRPTLVVHDAAAFAAEPVCRARGVARVEHGFGWPLDAARRGAAREAIAPLLAQRGLDPMAEGTDAAVHVDITPPSMRIDSVPSATALRLSLRPATKRARDPSGLPESVRALFRRLPAHRRVLVSFGTAFADRPAFAAAVRSLAREPLAVVAIGVDGQAQAWPRADNLVTEAWVDQAKLLPWCDLLVSHGGAGTVLGALAQGVPQIVLPQGADHFVNGAAVAARGLGKVCRDVLPEDALLHAVRELLSGSQWQIEAHAVAAEIESMPGPEHLAARLSDLVCARSCAGQAADDGFAEPGADLRNGP